MKTGGACLPTAEAASAARAGRDHPSSSTWTLSPTRHRSAAQPRVQMRTCGEKGADAWCSNNQAAGAVGNVAGADPPGCGQAAERSSSFRRLVGANLSPTPACAPTGSFCPGTRSGSPGTISPRPWPAHPQDVLVPRGADVPSPGALVDVRSTLRRRRPPEVRAYRDAPFRAERVSERSRERAPAVSSRCS
jgi:hypothetical protein